MKDSKNFYLVQNVMYKAQKVVYYLNYDGDSYFIYLHNSPVAIIKEPILIGILGSHTKRGYTFTSYFLSSKQMSVFVSNSEFTKYSIKEYKALLENERKTTDN